MKQKLLPFNLQFFADGGAGDGAGEGAGAGSGQQGQTGTAAFDYEKLASIINGAQTAKEDSVLKSYFKQQGLSQEEATQAMQQFKAEKAKNNPDVTAIQSQLTQAQQIAQQTAIEKEAVLEAVSLGLEAKSIPYVLKMADLSKVTDADGKVNAESLKNAINKVLEDVPQLKPSNNQNGGFQIGGAGGGTNKTNEDALKAAFGL